MEDGSKKDELDSEAVTGESPAVIENADTTKAAAAETTVETPAEEPKAEAPATEEAKTDEAKAEYNAYLKLSPGGDNAKTAEKALESLH